MWRRASALLLAGYLSAAPAEADTTLLARGRDIALQLCARCHAVLETGASPHKIVPPLRDLGERFPVDMLVRALETGVVGGHDEMPMFDIGEDGARALVTYIDSLSGTAPKYTAK